MTIYDLCIWIFRLFFRRESYLEERLKVMEYELTQKWPFYDSCKDHVSLKDLEHIERSMKSIQNKDVLYVFFFLKFKVEMKHRQQQAMKFILWKMEIRFIINLECLSYQKCTMTEKVDQYLIISMMNI